MADWGDDDGIYLAAAEAWEAKAGAHQPAAPRAQAPAPPRHQQPQQQRQQPVSGLRSLFHGAPGSGIGGAQQPGLVPPPQQAYRPPQQQPQPQPQPPGAAPGQWQRPHVQQGYAQGLAGRPGGGPPQHLQHQQQGGPPPQQQFGGRPPPPPQQQQQYGSRPPPQPQPYQQQYGAGPQQQQQQRGPPPQQQQFGHPPQQMQHGPPQGGGMQQRAHGAPQPHQPGLQQQWQPGQQPQGPHGSGHLGAGSGHGSGHQGAGSGRMASSGQGAGPLMYANLELSRDSMIEVKCGAHEAISAALKRLAGGVWDPKARHWRFPIAQHDRLVEALQGLTSVRVRVEPLVPVVASVLRASGRNPDDSERYCHIPASLEQQLMPFQREGVQFALRHGGRALIGDEMGLGKTVQAIAVAAAYRDEWPLLIIAPSSLREAWADALHRWLGLTDEMMHIVHTGKDAANMPKGVQCLIISYNFVQKMDLAKKFNVLICDECHYIKDGQAQRTKATTPLIKDARRALLLSGTPALNKPKEIFQQLSALVPSARLKMKDFGERYCLGNHFDKYGGATNLAELNAMLRNSVMVRRLKKDVLTQLPRKRRQQVILCLDADAKKQLAGLQKTLDVARQVMGEEARKSAASGGAAAGGGAGSMAQNTAITELYKKTAEVKAKAVQEYVQLLLDNNQKFLVFAHHTCLLDAIEHTCNRHKGCQHIRIDGSTPPSTRQGLVNKFQENQDVRVAILSIKAAGTGLTLTAASTVVFAEMTWTPGEIIQAEDRAHRIGQANSVNVYFLHARGSSDDLIWTSLEKKLDTVGEAIDGQGQALHAKRTEAPERGQATLQPFISQVPGSADPAAAQRQQVQQVQQGAERAGAAAGGGGGARSPSKASEKQSSLLQFYSAQPTQRQQQQAQPLPGQAGPPAALPASYQQQQQQPPQQLTGAPQQQPYVGHQRQAPPGPYHGPPHGPPQWQPVPQPPHQQQWQQQPQQPHWQQHRPACENAGPPPQQQPQQWQAQPQQVGAGMPPPALRSPSGSNVQRGAGGKPGMGGPSGQQQQQQQLAGTKRPYGDS